MTALVITSTVAPVDKGDGRVLVLQLEREKCSSFFSNTHVQQGGLHNLPQLLNLLFTPTNVTVGDIRLLLHLWYKNT